MNGLKPYLCQTIHPDWQGSSTEESISFLEFHLLRCTTFSGNMLGWYDIVCCCMHIIRDTVDIVCMISHGIVWQQREVLYGIAWYCMALCQYRIAPAWYCTSMVLQQYDIASTGFYVWLGWLGWLGWYGWVVCLVLVCVGWMKFCLLYTSDAADE